MFSVDDLALFVRVAELGSLSAAARAADLLPATASATLKRLEAALGVRLVERTTRKLRLTSEGEIWYEHARRALTAVEDGRAALAQTRSTIAGELRIAGPADFGRQYLLPWLAEFRREHPRLSVTLRLGDALSDLHAEPVDLAVRYGSLPDSALVARALATDNRRVVCAAPQYWARAGRPTTPADLTQHECLCYRLDSRPYTDWQFSGAKGAVSVQVRGGLASDDGSAVREWALAGCGVAYKSWIDVAADVRGGRLQTALDDWHGEPAPLYVVFPGLQHQPPRLRAVVDWLLARVATLPPLR